MSECIFCNSNKTLGEFKYWFYQYDGFPVSPGHMLIIPRRHVSSFFDLLPEELNELPNVITEVKNYVDSFYEPDGYNIGVNVGEAAGQSIMHCHIHIIPRYKGDVVNPRGGVRGVIPSKQNY